MKLSVEDKEALRIARETVRSAIADARRKYGRNVSINPLSKHAIKVIDRLLKEASR